MSYELTRHDGLVMVAERCFLFERVTDRHGKPVADAEKHTRWVAQAYAGGPLRWIDPAEIVGALYKENDGHVDGTA